MNTTNLRAVMAQAGLRVDHLTLRYADGGRTQIIEAGGFHPDGAPFRVTTEPFVGSPTERAARLAHEVVADRRLEAELNAVVQRIASARVVATELIKGRRAMSHLEKIEHFIEQRGKLTEHVGQRLDDLLARIPATKQKLDKAADRHETLFESEDKAFDGLDQAIDRMSNATGN